jgi:signal peptidase I
LENNPRKLWLAGILSFFTIGLGHLYAGNAKKGLFLYLGQGLLLALFLLILLLKTQHIFFLILIFFVLLAYLVFSIVDAIKAAKSNSTSYFLKKYNKWYFYLAFWALSSFAIGPIVETLILENTIKGYKIVSGSMTPTLIIGDRFFVNKFIYKNNAPQRGDIIVFEAPKVPSKDYVKRLMGVEGDIIEIKNKRLFVNNIEQYESYVIYKDQNIYPASIQPRDNYGPITVPENSLFFMGDNRDFNYDSRAFGFVSKKKVRGKVISLYWSWNEEAGAVRWGRIGKSIE